MQDYGFPKLFEFKSVEKLEDHLKKNEVNAGKQSYCRNTTACDENQG